MLYEDEKSPIQAVDGWHDTDPAGVPGSAESHTRLRHDHPVRALEVAMGRVSAAYGRHRQEGFLDTLGQIARGSCETVRSPLPGAMDGQLRTRNSSLWFEPIDSDVQYVDRANLQVKRRAQLLPFVGDDQIDVVIE